jgi:lipid-A-disaccharide synthase
MTTIFLTAAETSGDMHAANLIRALAARLPNAKFVGVGGPQMRAAGCELLEDVVAHAAMGLDVFTKLPYYRRVIRQIAGAMRQLKPSVLVPVDSPGLNWHMAAAARKLGVPVMYYVAPQVWAWAPWRVKKLARLTDHVACLLPFEQDYLRSRGVAATFVGHPMFDHLPARPAARPAPPADGAWQIVLLPGSRKKEIRRHAAAMADAAGIIRRSWPKAEFHMALADERGAELAAAAAGGKVPLVVGQTYGRIAEAHLAIATSGTVTLEAAYLGVPMVICYKASRLLFAFFRHALASTRYLTLANILANREVVPELIPWLGSAEALAAPALKLLADPPALERISRELIAVSEPLREPLGKPACEATADLVMELIAQREQSA